MSEAWLKTFMVTNVRGEEVPVVGTDVDGFLAAYEADDNIFWRADIGHIQNVVDELINRLSFAEAQLATAKETIQMLAATVHEQLRDARSESPDSSA
jgi:hypothetical protein